MMKVIVNGAGGRMGGQVLNILEERGQALQAELAAAVDPAAAEAYPALDVYQGPADVIVDFSFHTSVYALMEYAVSRKLPVVVATTGHSPEELDCIRAAAEQIPVFHAANLSLGIALLIRFAKQAAAAFPDADTFFPEYNASDYDEVFCERHEPSEKCKYAFSFVNLKRK